MAGKVEQVDTLQSYVADAGTAIGKFADKVVRTETVQNYIADASNAVVLSLDYSWLALGLVKPASTSGTGWKDLIGTYTPNWLCPGSKFVGKVQSRTVGSDDTPVESQARTDEKVSAQSSSNSIDRYDYTKLWSLKLGDYYMPLSQTFSLRARKRLNVSSIVDGIDIIQQTRKEAKTIDCKLRIALRDEVWDNLEMQKTTTTGNVETGLAVFAKFLQEFYENDAVFMVRNKMINETFGVQYVFISEYQFTPTVGKGTFQFNFSLTEVQYGDDVLTFDVREITGE